MSKFLKKIVEKKKVSIIPLIHERVAGYEKARSIKIIHASEVTKDEDEAFCPRQYALMDLTKKKGKDRFISTALRITFDVGRNTQKMFNEKWLKDKMVGDWQCSSCKSERSMCKKPKGHCGKSGIYCNWEYEEPRVTSTVTGVSCGLDALLDLDQDKLVLTEVKSMKGEDFKKLEAPLAEHRLRTQLYLDSVADSDLKDKVNSNWAIILYVSKAYGNKVAPSILGGVHDDHFSPFKEFIIKADPEAIKMYKRKALAVKKFREEDAGIPLGICKTTLEKRAKYCPMIKECFSGMYPGTQDW